MTPTEFEHHCAQLLRNEGWHAKVTQQSGDQGADVIGMFGGNRAVFQCKLYSKPAGNDAVQQIFAARRFYDANGAGVIASSGFTRSAYALARSAGVVLAAPAETPGFAFKMGFDRDRVIRTCDNCQTLLRIPRYQWGAVVCPACGHRRWFFTYWNKMPTAYFR